jgi:hypothetical protein
MDIDIDIDIDIDMPILKSHPSCRPPLFLPVDGGNAVTDSGYCSQCHTKQNNQPTNQPTERASERASAENKSACVFISSALERASVVEHDGCHAEESQHHHKFDSTTET